MSRRFYDDQGFQQDQPTTLAPGPSHHIARVLRMGVGDELVVFNGRGGEWRAVIESVGKQTVTVRPLHFMDTDRVPALAIHLGLPLIKGDRMDYALQKATEMGAASISLVGYERNEVRLNRQRMERKADHWRGVITGACEQCGLNRVPDLHGPVSLRDMLAAPADLRLVAHPGEQTVEATHVQSAASILLLSGPEGGFSDGELGACHDAGFQAFALGRRVLRAETAPVALMAALFTLGGGW